MKNNELSASRPTLLVGRQPLDTNPALVYLASSAEGGRQAVFPILQTISVERRPT